MPAVLQGAPAATPSRALVRPGRRPRRHRRRGIPGTVAAVVVGVLAANLGVLGSTGASMTARTTTNASFTAGSVILSDDDGGQALLQASGLVPGQTGSNCITVTYAGSLPAVTRLYADTLTGTLAPYLNLVVQVGSGGGFGSCAGFTASKTVYSGTLSTLVSAHGTFTDGLVGFDPAGPSSAVFKVTYTLDAAAPDAAQGASATAALRWQARDGAGYSGQVLADGPTTFWRLDDAPAATRAAALAGTATGTYSGTVTRGVAGPISDGHTATQFDGTGGAVSFGDVNDLRGDAPFSIEVWVRPDAGNAGGTFHPIVWKDGTDGWYVQYCDSACSTGTYPSTFYYERDSGASYAYLHPHGAVTTGQWHHLVVTDDGTTLTAYVDGALLRTQPSNLVVPDTTAPFVVGGDMGGSSAALVGAIANVAVYPYVLSQSQVEAHYALR